MTRIEQRHFSRLLQSIQSGNNAGNWRAGAKRHGTVAAEARRGACGTHLRGSSPGRHALCMYCVCIPNHDLGSRGDSLLRLRTPKLGFPNHASPHRGFTSATFDTNSAEATLELCGSCAGVNIKAWAFTFEAVLLPNVTSALYAQAESQIIAESVQQHNVVAESTSDAHKRRTGVPHPTSHLLAETNFKSLPE